jgi:hypothetical protein
MKYFNTKCDGRTGQSHRMWPTDGTTMLCLDCETEITVLEWAYILTVIKGGN